MFKSYILNVGCSGIININLGYEYYLNLIFLGDQSISTFSITNWYNFELCIKHLSFLKNCFLGTL